MQRPDSRQFNGDDSFIEPMSSMLEIADIKRNFSGMAAVRGVSFSVRAGEITCLLGPSGCGKSTTLRMIAGIEQPDAGVIRIDGQVMSRGRDHVPPERRSIGMVFQDLALFPHMTIAENVGFGLSRMHKADGRIGHLLERVGLPDHASKYPHQLSGGEQQRIALIRALATRPKVMLLDEPFSSLDQRLRVEMRELTRELLQEAGAAVVLVTHDPEEAMLLADRIAIMREGQIKQEGTPLELYDRPADLDVAQFFSDLNVVSGRVIRGMVETPFGILPAPGLADGLDVDCAIRPEHVRVARSDGAVNAACVMHVYNLGKENLLEVFMPGSEQRLRCCGTGYCPLSRGESVSVSLDPEKAMVFARV
ncbi:MAG: ABC transporter ATP-binding protein [Paracoccus sp. (in: a-proteobacteria)]